MEVPDRVKNIDYSKAQRIVHPKILELSQDDYVATEEEKKTLVKKYGSNKNIRYAIAGTSISFLLFIVFGLIFTFSVDSGISDLGILILLGIVSVSWTLLSVLGFIWSFGIHKNLLTKVNSF